MTKLPRPKATEVVKALKKLGFEQARVKGSHVRLIHPDGRRVTVPVHRETTPKGTLKSILRQAQIDVEELRENL